MKGYTLYAISAAALLAFVLIVVVASRAFLLEHHEETMPVHHHHVSTVARPIGDEDRSERAEDSSVSDGAGEGASSGADGADSKDKGADSAPASEEVVVTISYTLENMDYGQLAANPELDEELKASTQKTIAAEAGDTVTEDMVQVTLAAGSVIVTATVTLPMDKAKALVDAVQKDTFKNNLAQNVNDIPGIDAVITGGGVTVGQVAAKEETQEVESHDAAGEDEDATAGADDAAGTDEGTPEGSDDVAGTFSSFSRAEASAGTPSAPAFSGSAAGAAVPEESDDAAGTSSASTWADEAAGTSAPEVSDDAAATSPAPAWADDAAATTGNAAYGSVDASGTQEYAPLGAGDAAGKEEAVDISYTLENMDFGQLAASPVLVEELKASTRKTIAAEAGYAVTEDMVQVALTAGSVVVNTKVILLMGTAKALVGAAQMDAFKNFVAQNVNSIPGVNALVLGGVVVVGHVVVREEPLNAESMPPNGNVPPPNVNAQTQDLKSMPLDVNTVGAVGRAVGLSSTEQVQTATMTKGSLLAAIAAGLFAAGVFAARSWPRAQRYLEVENGLMDEQLVSEA